MHRVLDAWNDELWARYVAGKVGYLDRHVQSAMSKVLPAFGLGLLLWAASMCAISGADGTVAAQYTIVSTVLSFVTLPVIIGIVREGFPRRWRGPIAGD